MVLAPEHDLVKKWLQEGVIENKEEVESYIKEAKKKSEIERTNTEKEKTGVELKGVKAINPAIAKWLSQSQNYADASLPQNHAEETQTDAENIPRDSVALISAEIPVFIADYVLAHYGTGAIMAVPAHDERDYAFASQINTGKTQNNAERIKIRQVVIPKFPGPVISAGALIRNRKGEYIFEIKPDNYENNPGGVGLFGGFAEEGERPFECLKRELYEELGFDIEKQDVKITFLGYEESRKTPGSYHARYFIDNVDDADFVLSEESADILKVKDLSELERVGRNIEKNGVGFAIESLAYTPYVDRGELINSGPFDGMDSEEAKKEIVNWLGAEMTKTYRLRDWVVSRQRYWGVPIPVVHCEKCDAVPEKEENLPVLLPEIDDYLPSDDGKSPLAKVPGFVNTTCPVCGAPAKRETDTLDTFVDSSWYFLRYIDPENEKEFSSMEKQKIWMPVDFYSGGAEHTTMHLLYSRFWHKALFDLGLVKDKEPYKRRLNRGIILGVDGNKMSKSKGNVIDPDEVVEYVGADVVRGYLAFIGPYNEPGHYPWNPDGVVAIRRFLERVYGLARRLQDKSDGELIKLLHQTIKKVRDDVARLKFNTAISAMMVWVRTAEKQGVGKDEFAVFLRLLSPFAPHLAEELWHSLGFKDSVHLQEYPNFDEQLVKDSVVKVAVQVNGKVRAEVEISPDTDEQEVKEIALSNENVKKHIEGKEVRKFIYVPGRIVNIVVG